MRTTLTIEDDLAGLLKKRARDLDLPFKDVVNQALRAGLGQAAISKRRAVPKTVPHSFGFAPGVDLDKLNQLADELEAEASVQSWRKRRDSPRRQRTRSRA
jgi:hypothetical protein